MDYNSLTVAQIKAILDEKSISYTSADKKDDLIAKLEV
ncbi:HeH/LEM domain-containing protein [Enterococcus italicus]